MSKSMSATEELRKLLDERSIDYRIASVHDMPVTLVEDGNITWSFSESCRKLIINGCASNGEITPTRAVEATLGVGECRIEYRHDGWYCTGCGDMVGTIDPWDELCVYGNAVESWDYCPTCGRKVVGR